MRRYCIFFGGPLDGEVKAMEGNVIQLTPPEPGPGERVINYEMAWTMRFHDEPSIRLMVPASANPLLRLVRAWRAKRRFRREYE